MGRADFAKWQTAVAVIVVVALAFGIIAQRFINPAATPKLLHNYSTKDEGNDLHPAIAYGNGRWTVVWQSDDSLKVGTPPVGDTNIFVSTSSNGMHWAAPKPLSTAAVLKGAADAQPSVATDGADTWLVAWRSTADVAGSGTDFDILQITSTDNTKTWKNLAPLNSNAAVDHVSKPKYVSDSSPRVATDGKGNWVATWEGNSWAKSSENPGCEETPFSNPRTYIEYTSDVKTGWDNMVCVQQSSTATYAEPAVASDGKGNWVIPLVSTGNALFDFATSPCGVKNLGSDPDIVVVTSTNTALSAAAFPPSYPFGTCYPSMLSHYAETDSALDGSPAIASDGQQWVAVWSSDVQQFSDGGKMVQLGADYDLLISVSNDGKSWSTAKPLNSNAATDSGSDRHPALAVSGKDWVVVWESTEALGGLGTDADVLVVRSTDAGKSWSAPRALHDNAGSDIKDDQRPQIATDGTRWVVVWHSYEDGGTGPDADILTAQFTLPLP